MFKLRIVPPDEVYDPRSQEFIYIKPQTILLEHSLLSISKWESFWKKSFVETKLNREELYDYIRCMTITQNVDDRLYMFLTEKDYNNILDYIKDPMTATTITDRRPGRPGKKEIVTSELVYYWMISYGIPVEECQKWHFNRLMTLIRICSVKENPSKMSKKDIYSMNRAENAARRAKSHSRG